MLASVLKGDRYLQDIIRSRRVLIWPTRFQPQKLVAPIAPVCAIRDSPTSKIPRTKSPTILAVRPRPSVCNPAVPRPSKWLDLFIPLTRASGAVFSINTFLRHRQPCFSSQHFVLIKFYTLYLHFKIQSD